MAKARVSSGHGVKVVKSSVTGKAAKRTVVTKATSRVRTKTAKSATKAAKSAK